MKPINEKYVVAICTMGENSNLNRMINLLCRIKERDQVSFDILIVVNSTTLNISSDNTVQVIFEPNKGYAKVRNRALEYVGNRANLIFIDDDQIPTLEWLQNLISTHEKFPLDIVVGPVYPSHSDEEMRNSYRSQFVQLYRQRQNESLVRQGPTANMLIPMPQLDLEDVFFDLHFNASGSEDTDFCFRMRSKGYFIRFAKEAWIQEIEKEERFVKRYLNHRKVKDITNYSVVIRRNSSYGAIFWRFVTLLIRVLCHLVGSPLSANHRLLLKAHLLSMRSLINGRVIN